MATQTIGIDSLCYWRVLTNESFVKSLKVKVFDFVSICIWANIQVNTKSTISLSSCLKVRYHSEFTFYVIRPVCRLQISVFRLRNVRCIGNAKVFFYLSVAHSVTEPS